MPLLTATTQATFNEAEGKNIMLQLGYFSSCFPLIFHRAAGVVLLKCPSTAPCCSKEASSLRVLPRTSQAPSALTPPLLCSLIPLQPHPPSWRQDPAFPSLVPNTAPKRACDTPLSHLWFVLIFFRSLLKTPQGCRLQPHSHPLSITLVICFLVWDTYRHLVIHQASHFLLPDPLTRRQLHEVRELVHVCIPTKRLAHGCPTLDLKAGAHSFWYEFNRSWLGCAMYQHRGCDGTCNPLRASSSGGNV